MESVVRDAVTEHLTSNKQIKPSLHGVVKGKSCVTNLLEFLDKATISMETPSHCQSLRQGTAQKTVE
jgi:hypothetical protein